jgi:hypothetical protein
MATKKQGPTASASESNDGPQAVEARLLEAFPEIREVSVEAVQERMAARVQKATSLDELFDSLEGNSSDKLVGKSFEFTAIAWQPYESQRGIIPMAIVTATNLDTGEEEEFVTTGGMLVQFLRRAQVLGALPFSARIVEKATKGGQKALNFERV